MRILRTAGPWIAAGCMWAADIATAFADSRSAPWHGVLDAAALAVTVWALLTRYSVRGRKGERLISDEDYQRTEEAITRAVLAASGNGTGPGVQRSQRTLKSA